MYWLSNIFFPILGGISALKELLYISFSFEVVGGNDKGLTVVLPEMEFALKVTLLLLSG